MIIVYENDPDKQKYIIASVFPFLYIREFAIIVRPYGVVEIDGSASLDADHARRIAAAIIVASKIAEGVHVNEDCNLSCDSCEKVSKMCCV